MPAGKVMITRISRTFLTESIFMVSIAVLTDIRIRAKRRNMIERIPRKVGMVISLIWFRVKEKLELSMKISVRLITSSHVTERKA
jgi:hypothetical protein